MESKNNSNKEQNHSRLTALPDDALDTIAGGYDPKPSYHTSFVVNSKAEICQYFQFIEEGKEGGQMPVKTCENCRYQMIARQTFPDLAIQAMGAGYLLCLQVE